MRSLIRWTALLVLFLSVFIRPALAGPFILVDAKSERVLAADRPTDPWYPASITKLMTIYVAAQAVRQGELSLKSLVTMSKNSNRVQPSKMGFKVGTKVTLENALLMLAVKSANDIAVAIGERVSGSEKAFVARMNRTARAIGMTRSRFTNPHGLPSKGQFVTARDMAVLALAIHKEFPEMLPLFEVPAIRFGKRTLRSYNLVLEHYRGAVGMKTGFICAAGLNMVASAKRGGKTLIAVILGELSSIDRAEKAALVMERGFEGAFKKARGKIFSYNPSPRRATPVNMRPVICGGHRKIRTFQIVTPVPKPKRGLFKRKAKYESPQRKFFGENLGDKSHPQGALVQQPGRRAFRSHILHPRRAKATVPVYAGPHRPGTRSVFAIRLERGAEKRLAKVNEIARANAAVDTSTLAPGVPLPKRNPLRPGAQTSVAPELAPNITPAPAVRASTERRTSAAASLFQRAN